MKIKKLKELCTSITDCPHSTPIWKNAGIRVVRNFNLIDGDIDFTDGYYVDESAYQERTRRAVPEEGDIIISREAPMGIVGIVPTNLKCCLGQRLVLLKVNKHKCNPYYLLYVLMSDYVQTQFKRANATGSIVSNLCIPDLEELAIPFVEDNQENIARVLQNIHYYLREKKKINDNLQQMAHAKYMHMFFSKIPNAKFGDIIIEHQKSTIQVNDAKETSGSIPFFTSGDAILKWTNPLTSGRNIFLNTGGNADVKFYVGEAAYSTDTWCITAKNELEDYLYLLLESIRPELNKKFFQGTGLKHLQKPLLKDRPIYIPTDFELNQFNEDIKGWMSMISDNIRESEVLISFRDWLLPMLMNGQATIED